MNKYEYSLKNIRALLDFIINKLAVYYATIVRAAFIGYKEFLDLQKKNYITKEEFDNFFCGINTITSMQIVDANKLKKGEIKIKEFKAKGFEVVKVSDLIYKENYNINSNGTQIKQ